MVEYGRACRQTTKTKLVVQYHLSVRFVAIELLAGMSSMRDRMCDDELQMTMTNCDELITNCKIY